WRVRRDRRDRAHRSRGAVPFPAPGPCRTLVRRPAPRLITSPRPEEFRMADHATLRQRLRALATFPRPGLPRLDPDAVPASPHELFTTWLEEVIDAGVLAPHAVVLSTADDAGAVHARTVILKDVTEAGWWFASQSNGQKGRDLEVNPHAAMTF